MHSPHSQILNANGMNCDAHKSSITLDPEQIREAVFKRLQKYHDLNEFEQFAMFMGMAQILEAGLKSLLVRRYQYGPDKMDRWTLGRLAAELKRVDLRADYLALLDSVVGYRNYIAHEYLANDATLKAILGGSSGRLERKQLDKGIYELEQIMFLHDWCEEHDSWG
jgi:hypothetical protein